MKKRFIICHNPGTPEQDEAFKNWLNSQGVGWWHWLTGSWLVIAAQGKVSVEQIRDASERIYKGALCMVFEHGSNLYAGLGPNDEERRKRMAGWLEKNWKAND